MGQDMCIDQAVPIRNRVIQLSKRLVLDRAVSAGNVVSCSIGGSGRDRLSDLLNYGSNRVGGYRSGGLSLLVGVAVLTKEVGSECGSGEASSRKCDSSGSKRSTESNRSNSGGGNDRSSKSSSSCASNRKCNSRNSYSSTSNSLCSLQKRMIDEMSNSGSLKVLSDELNIVNQQSSIIKSNNSGTSYKFCIIYSDFNSIICCFTKAKKENRCVQCCKEESTGKNSIANCLSDTMTKCKMRERLKEVTSYINCINSCHKQAQACKFGTLKEPKSSQTCNRVLFKLIFKFRLYIKHTISHHTSSKCDTSTVDIDICFIFCCKKICNSSYFKRMNRINGEGVSSGCKKIKRPNKKASRHSTWEISSRNSPFISLGNSQCSGSINQCKYCLSSIKCGFCLGDYASICTYRANRESHRQSKNQANDLLAEFRFFHFSFLLPFLIKKFKEQIQKSRPFAFVPGRRLLFQPCLVFLSEELKYRRAGSENFPPYLLLST